ncbi:MAG: winged helix-turn-helix domain-containing protein [Candidatus Kariarchaeaceae archaeon]|jgi:DNA-binding transcriptional ArsR family regulator
MASLSIAQIDKIFSNKLRVDIMLHLLSQGELTLTQITELTGKSKSAMSRQMKQLVQYDMIDEFEQDLNNPGSPHKAYRISQSFVDTFMRIRDQDAFFDQPDRSSYISYIMGMIAVSSRMNSLTRKYLEGLEGGEKPQSFVDMGMLIVDESSVEEAKMLIEKFVRDIYKLPKSGPGEHLISISMFPFGKILD